MRRKNNYLVAVANNGKLHQRFMPDVPRTFDHDCSSEPRAKIRKEEGKKNFRWSGEMYSFTRAIFDDDF